MMSSVNMFDFDVIKDSLPVTENGVSFCDRGLKLNSVEDAKEIVDAINTIRNLEYLNLQGNTLGVEASKVIAEALQKHPEFRRALWKDMFTGRMKTEIPMSLNHLGDGMIKANCQLYELDLSENAFGEIAIQALATFLTSKSCHSLKELRLNNNGLGITGGKALAAALTTAFDASNKTLALKVFIAGRNRLEDAGTSALAAVFEQMKSLEEIQMPQNGIRLPGIKAMFEALSANRALKIINFNDNTIKPDGCTYVSHALTKLPLLEKLDLGDCLLQQTGAVHVVRSLNRYQPNLKELILDSNEIKLQGILDIIDLIGSQCSLEKISFNGNSLTMNDVTTIHTKMDSINRLEILGSFSDNEDFDDDDEEDEGGEFISDQDDDDEGNGDDIEDEDDVGVIEDNYREDVGIDDEDDGDDDDDDDDYESDTNRANEEENSVMSNEYEKVEFSDVTESEMQDNPEWILRKIDDFVASGNTNKDVVDIVGDFCSKSLELLFKFMSVYSDGEHFDICEEVIKKIHRYVDKFDQINRFNDVLLIYLKLIKSEDKSFKITWNMDSSYRLMLRFVSKSLIRKTTLDYLRIFIERVEKRSSEMQDLYNYLAEMH